MKILKGKEQEYKEWHNKEYDYEGEGTVNPAILTVKRK